MGVGIVCGHSGCKGVIGLVVETYRLDSRIAGPVEVPDVPVERCSLCSVAFLSSESADVIFTFVRAREAELIAAQPIADFIAPKDVAALLELPVRQLERTPRISRGFIMATRLGGRRYYLRRSAEQYKATGDGRLLLSP